MKDIGIYVHIPFCKQKCYYCDFISYVGKEKLVEKYINILIKEITDEDEINNYLNKLFEILKKINNNDDLEKVDIYSVIERMEL